MKKIHLAHLLYFIGPAGKEQGVLKIVSGMDRSRFEVDIIVLQGVRYRELLPVEQFNIIELQGTPANSWETARRLAEVLKRNRYDIVYTHSWNTLLEGYLAARLAKIPALIHGEHGTFERSFMKDRVQKYLWQRFDAVTVVAGDLEKKLRDSFGYRKDNISVLYNGIDPARFYPSPEFREKYRRQYGLEGSFVVGTLGRFHPVKDHFTLIKAFRRFRETIPAAKLVLVGGGGSAGEEMKRRYQELIAQLSLQEQVRFIPPVSDPETLLNMFDVFVLSSVSEGCSNVILEAQACGVPVLATATGGNPELVNHQETGLLFPVGDEQTLAGELHRLYADEDLRRRFSRQALERVREKFSLRSTVSGYEQLYRNLYHSKMNGKVKIVGNRQ